ncbi:MAG: enoyl-CoA hydratase/isomerase family protein [Sneathiellales bacterium]|nr:enoyl-CoA hydratase/isomerase family protein [Sneathiellales bacterium]
MPEPVKIAINSGIGIIELARPDKFNCLSIQAFEVIRDAIQEFEQNRDVKSILIQSQGKNFCTGADLEEVKTVRENPDQLRDFIGTGHEALTMLEMSPLPVVVAVQGLCLAGGLELMLAADICIAGKTARFGDQHAQFGLIPGWGGSQRLTKLIGLRKAMDLFLSATWITAGEAEKIGLINRITDDEKLLEEATTYCHELANKSAAGLAEMKKLARRGLDLSWEAALAMEEETAVTHLLMDDVTEGLSAFKERRTPEFKS